MKKLLLYISLSLLFTACDRFLEIGAEEVLDDIDLKIEPMLVVNGMITEQDTVQTIKLSTTKSMYANEGNRVVNAAEVQVLANGERFQFDYVDSLQSYVCKMKGVPNVEYTLEVLWNGKKYTAKETMADLQQFSIDSVEIKKAKYDFYHLRYFDADAPFRKNRDKEILISVHPNYSSKDTLIGGAILEHNVVYLNPDNRNEVLTTYKYGDLAEFWFGGDPYIIQAAEQNKAINVYKIYLHAKESQVESNYYRFDIKREGKSWLHPGQLIVANDFALRANIEGIEFPGFFIEGDNVEFIMYGISKKAYNFYVSLQSVLQNDGGNYSSIPGNPPTNIFDQDGKPALGYFEVNKVATLNRKVNL